MVLRRSGYADEAQVPAQAVSVDRLILTADAVRGADAADIIQPIGCGCFAEDGE